MKVLTVSRFYQKGHAREGQPTFFVEKICNALGVLKSSALPVYNTDVAMCVGKKKHTIRMGQRWKIGDDISIRVWSGLPYRSKQIEIAVTKVANIFNFQIIQKETEWEFFINGIKVGSNVHQIMQKNLLPTIAKNDGLTVNDFLSWFRPKKYPFHFAGQIICWSNEVNYTQPENVMTGSHCI